MSPSVRRDDLMYLPERRHLRFDSSHLCVAAVASQLRGSDIMAAVEPKMPTLRQMHEIVAADLRAQAKFFLLMSELRYRFILGIERLHIGRMPPAHPHHPPRDLVATSLLPSVCPGTTDVRAFVEAPGRLSARSRAARAAASSVPASAGRQL